MTSSTLFNNSHADVIVMAITSQIPSPIPKTSYLLNREEINEAGLPKPSLVRVDKIITINKLLIRKQLGKLPVATIDKIKTILFNLI